MLSGYRLMWLVVMFDLPVVQDDERKAATKFRNALLDLGFEMAQFSVYMRFCTGPEHSEALVNNVRSALPEGGKVNVLFFTDKQYERILTFHGKSKQAQKKNPGQFDLF
jgi:CRISPR-associated protein Cas2